MIDESKIDAKTKEKAEKVEREILTDSSNTNVHIMEDRGQTGEKDNNDDEEEKYSGVKRALGKH